MIPGSIKLNDILIDSNQNEWIVQSISKSEYLYTNPPSPLTRWDLILESNNVKSNLQRGILIKK